MYVIYTQVDAKTGVPASQTLMRNGPKMPEGITFSFALESQYPLKNDQHPVFYGTTDRDDLPEWVDIITQEQFEADRDAEMQARYDKLLAQKIEQAAAERWRVETAGITLDNGAFVNTAEKDQNRISNAYSSLKNGLVDQIDFKGANGWAVMTLVELEPIAKAVAQHVSTYCFGAERDVTDQLNSMDYTALQTADVQQLFEDAYQARKELDNA
ncbi:hypothetical protein ACPUEK_15825 [Marinomonas gallaica]|uniref:DUF4376 domain-containing protein n=1 Tax=Marinomonas gallaica TaxID=1806667 RepID=UPI003CE476D3